MLAELGDDRARFATAEQLAAEGGVAPVTHASGRHRGVAFAGRATSASATRPGCCPAHQRRRQAVAAASRMASTSIPYAR
jgi:transposase